MTGDVRTNGGRDAQQEALDRAPTATPRGQPLIALTLAALGVAYGDIGTSPIYALRVCFVGADAVPASPEAVLGVLSLVFWTLILSISLKYMTFVLRADNRGEGGIFALLSLLHTSSQEPRWPRRALMLLGIAGAAMLFGDALITPAISVLSAVEGLKLAAPRLAPFVEPITVAILAALFSIQRFGTAVVGALFGPVMCVWFVTLIALGAAGILRAPAVLGAVNPWYAVRFFETHGLAGYLVLGGVFLVTTGGEALYADLGHLGRTPIRRAWFSLVLPALLINYFGQGAQLISRPHAGFDPFFDLAPSWALYGLIALATFATCIASQAAITGAYSLVQQAIHLGQMPRLRITQTSAEARGQIYVPSVNWLLMAGAVALVLAFHSSDGLAGAYGVAVNSTMAITTVLAFNVVRERGWSLPAALTFLVGFLAIDLGFLGSNLAKIPRGGWLPILVAGVLFTIMTTWRRGTTLLARQIAAGNPSLQTFVGRLAAESVRRVSGTGVFFTGRLEQTPPALQQLVRHTGVLYENVILVTVVIEQVPKVGHDERIELTDLEHGFHRLILRYGFMQSPNVPSELATCAERGLPLELDKIHYIIGHVDMLAGRRERGMARWRDRLFAWMARNTKDATSAYQIPSDRVMSVGLQVGI